MPETKEEYITISGMAEEIVFKNTQNGYIVITMDIDGRPETVCGNLGDIVEGESLVLRGNYTTSAKYGRQFKAVTCERKLPETPEEIRRYLGSGIIKGVGPAMAKKIVNAFGTETLSVIENDPMRLSTLNGISADKALFIGSEFRRLNGMRMIVEFLQKYEISPLTASLVWQEYEGKSVELVMSDPYILCGEEFSVAFGSADRIAFDLGLSMSGMSRIKAGITYVLRENAAAGHTCLPRNVLTEVVCPLIRVDEEDFDKALFAGIEEGIFSKHETTRREYIFLSEYYHAERYITGKLGTMMRLSAPLEKDYSDDIKRIEEQDGIHYEKLQIAAINAALGNKVFILTGGPGTGKTTTLNAVIKLCERKHRKMMLAAPTGRAAKRMSDLTGRPAKTIHRLLEVDFTGKSGKPKFAHNEKNPLEADIIIIDEMSMVDVLLFDALLRAVRNDCSLILVGDSNQLPSVGAGNVLRDLIATTLIPTVEIKEIFRQAAESLIVTNAHKIVNGEMPELDNRKKDFFFMPTYSDEETARLVVDLIRTRLPKTYGYSPVDDIQVLSPTKMGMVGTKELNKSLQAVLCPPSQTKRELKFIDSVFRTGDKVMQIKNDYDVVWKRDGKSGTGIFNGDIGIIYEVDTQNSLLHIDFDGRMAVYTNDMLGKLDLAYAVTIHKSQGSEYKAVIMPLNLYSNNLLFRNLLYTGVTRAKEILIIVGSREAVERMVQNDKKTNRYSCIRAMLKENGDDVYQE
ncbi:MAG: ATP-dependent RecD-like DNA helicase, partial [Ruminiclostridium sp.]|nr:ATP-dependent RecD-like DNA helicase [Ruminiclostridium sp.]